MGVSLNTGSSKGGVAPTMNVTPLIDVVLVLLIIFMVVTPAVNEGEQLELPTVTTPDEKKKDEPISFTVALSGAVLVNDNRMDLERARKELTALQAADPDKGILLKFDKGIKYEKVREYMKLLQDIGFQVITLKVVVLEGGGSRGGGH